MLRRAALALSILPLLASPASADLSWEQASVDLTDPNALDIYFEVGASPISNVGSMISRDDFVGNGFVLSVVAEAWPGEELAISITATHDGNPIPSPATYVRQIFGEGTPPDSVTSSTSHGAFFDQIVLGADPIEPFTPGEDAPGTFNYQLIVSHVPEPAASMAVLFGLGILRASVPGRWRSRRGP